MRTASEVLARLQIADDRLDAIRRELQKAFIDPIAARLVEIIQRHHTRNRIRAFLGRGPL